MNTENTPNEDPCDGITSETLDGWTRYDSSGMCKENTGQRLGGRERSGYQDTWIRFDND